MFIFMHTQQFQLLSDYRQTNNANLFRLNYSNLFPDSILDTGVCHIFT